MDHRLRMEIAVLNGWGVGEIKRKKILNDT